MRHLVSIGLIVLAILPSRGVYAQDLVALVDLKFLAETDKVARVLCLGEDNCFPWAHHYLWEAKVRRIISGEETERRFLVLFGAHALKKQDFRGIVAAMDRLESNAPSEARYQISEWAQERELLCFSAIAAEDAPLKLSESDNQFGCFEIEAKEK